ncbi:DUF4407 domain-containing protein [Longimicrobium sp.]|uniref:DUF4407 domain-containing protein n=1 Tax=Longimicrobium sp. TaxID=2029185 RepID=UPI003B3AD5F7
MKRFLLFCSGANTTILKACPTDESKYAGIGATILLTAVLASLSGGYALFTVFRSIPVAAAFGVLWGVMIFNLDRVIVSGMRKQKHPLIDLGYALPRLGIAFLLAVVISRPLELKLFEAEIRNQWAQMQIDERNAAMKRIEGGHGGRLAQLRAENVRLKTEVDAERKEHRAAEEAWIREKAGTGDTGIPGPGPVFREREKALEEATRQMTEMEARNDSVLARNNAEIKRLEDEQNGLIARTDSVREGALGFLNRMEAFGVLKKNSKTIERASLFITMLFVALEIAPVMVKLLSTLSPFRPYDELLEKREFEIVEAARQQVRVRKQKLKALADRRISDDELAMDAELRLSTEKNQLRLDAELRANEALIQHIADAQTELAERLVDEWKRREMEKIEDGVEAYVQRVP